MNETQYFRLPLRERQAARANHGRCYPVFTKTTPRQRLPAPPPFPRNEIRTTTAPCRAECHNDSSRAPYDIPEGTRFRIECRDSDTHTTCTHVDAQAIPVPLTPDGFCYRFALPNAVVGIPDHTNEGEPRTFWIESGHGLRVVPVADIITLDHKGWYVDQFQDETTAAHIIRLPKRKGFLLAASDPWNDDAFTVLNEAPMPAAPVARMHGPPDPDQGTRDAARAAEQFTERLAEDYRDDSEHQQALHDYEEALAPLEKAKDAADQEAEHAEQERVQAQAEAFALVETAAGFTTQATSQERQQIGEAFAAAQARADQHEAERDAAQATAADLQDQIDELEAPTAPNFNYFGKVKR